MDRTEGASLLIVSPQGVTRYIAQSRFEEYRQKGYSKYISKADEDDSIMTLSQSVNNKTRRK